MGNRLELLEKYGFKYANNDTYYATWSYGGTLNTNRTSDWDTDGIWIYIEDTGFCFSIEDYQKFLDIMVLDETYPMKGHPMPDWDYQSSRE